MVKSIDYSQRKWERKTAGKGIKWKERVGESKALASSQMAAFVGHPVPDWATAYNAGVDGMTAADFEAAITGKGPKWAAAMRAIKQLHPYFLFFTLKKKRELWVSP